MQALVVQGTIACVAELSASTDWLLSQGMAGCCHSTQAKLLPIWAQGWRNQRKSEG